MRKLTFLLTCLFLVGVGLVNAQSKSISGKVLSAEDGQPIIGATVKVKGSTVGTITNVDGEFKISLQGDAKNLVVSYVGMITADVQAVNGITVKLQSDAKMIDEVLVVAYGTAKKSSFTGSVSSIGSKQLSKIQMADVSKSLEGAVSGVTVSSASGQPGQATKIRIRGIGSIYASSEPLIILDGAPFEGSINSINTADVESINVLKDAASAALYGARGANGVVIITTKKGKDASTQVNFDAKVGYNYRGVPEYNVMKDPNLYYETAWEAVYNKAKFKDNKSDADARLAASADLYSMLGYNAYNVANDQIVLGDGKINPLAKIKYKDADWNNWEKELYEPRKREEYNMSLSKGTDINKVYFSLGYLGDKGFNRNTDFSRYTSRLAYDSKMYSWLDFSTSAQFSATESNWSQTGSSYTNSFQWTRDIAPIYPIYLTDANGSVITDKGQRLYDFGEIQTGVNEARAYGAKSNPVATQDKDIDNNKDYYLIQNANLKIKLPYNITFNTTQTASGNWYSYNSYTTPTGGSGLAYNGISNKQKTQTVSMNWNQILRWNHKFGEANVDLMLGHETFSRKFDLVDGEKSNFVDPANSEWANASKITSLTSYSRDYKLEGYFGQVTGDYLNRYFVSASLRKDGSSVFHPDNRWGTFWSVGASWRVNEESFMKQLDFINNLKLKGSYGLQGNDYLYLANSTTRRAYSPYKTLYGITSDGSNPGLEAKYLGRKEVTWEKNKNFNVGLEFSVFSNLISGEVEYFSRVTKDLLFNLPVPASTGFTTEPWNIGDMSNKGSEVTLNANILQKKNLRWTVSVNLTSYKNKVISLPEKFKANGITRGTQKIFEGGSIYDFYLVKYAGVDPTNGDALYWQKNAQGVFEKVGSANYSATNNEQNVGSAIPDLQGGFSTSLEFYGFDLFTQFSYQIGGKMLDSEYSGLMHAGTMGNNWSTDIANRWTPTNTITDVPRIEYNNQNLNAQSDRFLTDASYLSLKTVNFGYSLPKSVIKKAGLTNLRLYVSADNVALWSKRKGMDPRVSLSGLNNESVYSPIRSFSMGLVVNL